MVEVASEVDIGYQEELWIGRTVASTTTWTQVLGLEELAGPSKVPEKFDSTHMQSPGRSRENKYGLKQVAEWSQELQFWPGSDHDVLLRDLYGLTQDGTPERVQVEFLWTNGATPVRMCYEAVVTDYTISSPLGDKRTVTVGLDVFDEITPSRVIA